VKELSPHSCADPTNVRSNYQTSHWRMTVLKSFRRCHYKTNYRSCLRLQVSARRASNLLITAPRTHGSGRRNSGGSLRHRTVAVAKSRPMAFGCRAYTTCDRRSLDKTSSAPGDLFRAQRGRSSFLPAGRIAKIYYTHRKARILVGHLGPAAADRDSREARGRAGELIAVPIGRSRALAKFPSERGAS
jgi:hypothetical protein